jgi:hypothetical protein
MTCNAAAVDPVLHRVGLRPGRKVSKAAREPSLFEAADRSRSWLRIITGQVSPQLLATQGNSTPALVASRASGIYP